MKEVYEFLSDACRALDLLGRYYRINFDEAKIRKEMIDGEEYFIGDSFTEEIGWRSDDIYSKITRDDGRKYTFNDACKSLIDSYEEKIDIFSEDNCYDGRYFASVIESILLKSDSIQREAILKKTIRYSFRFLLPDNTRLLRSFMCKHSCSLFANSDYLSDEEIEEYEVKDEAGLYKASSIVSWLTEQASIFLSEIGTMCCDFNINIIDIIHSSRPCDISCLDLSVFEGTETDVNLDKSEENNDKAFRASAIQRWTIIRHLMERATGWRLTNNEGKLMYNKKDIAKFMSFLCGGSEDVIRKHLEDELPVKDVNAILPYLNNIGLHEIAERIKNDTM